MDYIFIGASPPDEKCVQVGTPDYMRLSRIECNKYIKLLREFFGNEPPGCKLKIMSQQHEYGQYLEVICEYSDGVGRDYALKCEGEGPLTWDEKKS